MIEPAIRSAANPRVKAWLRLRDRRERERTGLTLVDGTREVGRALAAGAVVEELLVGPTAHASEEGRRVLELAAAARVPSITVSAAVEARLAFGDRVDGVVAVLRVPSLALDRIVLPADPLVVVVEGIEKPGNLGAVLRSADGAAADAVIVADARTDPYNPNAIRASLGTIFSVPLAVGPSATVRDWCRDHHLEVVAARVDASSVYSDAELTGRVAIVLGSEAEGLGDAWRGSDVVAVHLPMRGVADSLNVSVAAAVLLYEARRQRDARVG